MRECNSNVSDIAPKHRSLTQPLNLVHGSLYTYIQSLLDAIVVVGVEKAVDFLWLVAAEKVNVALHHVRWSAGLVPAGLSVEEGGEEERAVLVCTHTILGLLHMHWGSG